MYIGTFRSRCRTFLNVPKPSNTTRFNGRKNTNSSRAPHSFSTIPKLQLNTCTVFPHAQQFALLSPDNKEYCQSKIFLAQIKNFQIFPSFSTNRSFLLVPREHSCCPLALPRKPTPPSPVLPTVVLCRGGDGRHLASASLAQKTQNAQSLDLPTVVPCRDNGDKKV